jgi:hypothetical protein
MNRKSRVVSDKPRGNSLKITESRMEERRIFSLKSLMENRIIIIIVKNKKDKTCLLIDVAIPSDKNIIQKEAKRN